MKFAVDDNVHTSASSSIVKDSIDEPTRSERCRIETSFGLGFLINFLIDDFEVNFLFHELLTTLFIEEDPKTYREAVRSIDFSFEKKPSKVS